MRFNTRRDGIPVDYPIPKVGAALRLFIQIPCFNEEQSLAAALRSLPRSLPGVDEIYWLVIDDGSQDDTVRVARENGVDYILRLPRHLGLAAAFSAGLRACLAHGADLIVNTDADNQYNAEDIPELIRPLLEGKSDLVIGCRDIRNVPYFSRTKKALQIAGSALVRAISRTAVSDTRSGFRAMTRTTARRLRVFGTYTYTLETLVQAGTQGVRVACVPVRVNPCVRPSRLIRNIPMDLFRSGISLAQSLLLYRPFAFFAPPIGICFSAAYFAAPSSPASWLWMSSGLVCTAAACLAKLTGSTLESINAGRSAASFGTNLRTS